MYKLEVRPYIPPPLQCFRCQRYGHMTSTCTSEETCVCGKPTHTGKECDSPPMCVNCNGNHSTRYRGCPIYKQEQAIQRLRTLEHISYGDAKKKIVVKTPHPNITYAQATQSRQPQLQDIINQLSPILETIVRKCISELITKDTPSFISMGLPPPSSKTSEGVVTRSRAGSEASTSSKRKAKTPADESDQSEESAQSADLRERNVKRFTKKSKARTMQHKSEPKEHQPEQNIDCPPQQQDIPEKPPFLTQNKSI